jgi:Zn-dependent membrane protease YugP
MFFISPTFLILVGPAILLAFYAQYKVKKTYKKYANVNASAGLTARQAAQRVLEFGASRLNKPDLQHVGIEQAEGGGLTDHYDPRKKVLRLSNPDSRALADIGVAAHEAGHAIQDAAEYQPLVIRSALVPAVSFGSNLAMPLIMVGLILTMMGTALGQWVFLAGILGMAAMVVFTLVTLPVEFNASSRAKEVLVKSGVLSSKQELSAVSSVLNSAALTYVASAAVAIMQLAYFVLMFLGMRR